MLKSHPKKKQYAPVDEDMALMEKLDKGPPATYEAWKPDEQTPNDGASPEPAASSPSAGQSSLGSAAASLSAMGASLDSDDFLQLGWQTNRVVSDLAAGENSGQHFRLLASETAAAAARAASPSGDDGVSRLIMETVSQEADEPDAAAAAAVLSSYADVLKSKPLRELSDTRLNREKLQALYQRMQSAAAEEGRQAQDQGQSALAMPSGTGQEAQAEQWCLRFHQEGQASSPVLAARTRADAADAELAEAGAKRDAVQEEREAHDQLLKTAKLDSKGLAALLQTVQQSYDPISVDLGEWQERAAALGLNVGGESLQLYQAAGAARSALSQARNDLTTAIAAATRKRTIAEQRQQMLLKQVAADVEDAAQVWSAKSQADQASRAGLDSAVRSFNGVEAMCDQALEAANNKKHSMLREVRAVGMALAVLGVKKR